MASAKQRDAMGGDVRSRIKSLMSSFEPSGFFLLRSPLLSFDEWIAWNNEASFAYGGECECPAGIIDLSQDRERLTDHLRAVFSRPEVREALYLASPDLEARLTDWEAAPNQERGRRVGRALVRYFSRMATRATPFGLFAGCSLGTLGNTNQLLLLPRDKTRRHTQLDCDFLFSISAALRRMEYSREIRWRINSSLCVVAGRYQYVEEVREGDARSFRVVAVDISEHLQSVVDVARVGATLDTMAACLTTRHDATIDEAMAFLEELAESQLITPDIEVPLTGEEPISQFIARLRTAPKARDVVASLEDVSLRLAEIDRQPIGTPIDEYQDIEAALKVLDVSISTRRLFHVVAERPVAAATLAQGTIQDIARAVSILQLVGLPRPDPLTRFRDAFAERYELREVPLVEAIDREVGLGSILDEDLVATNAQSPVITARTTIRERGLTSRERTLLSKVVDAMSEGSIEICVTPDDLEARDSVSALPSAFAAHVVLARETRQADEVHDYTIVLEGVNGPSGALLLGRFCHALPSLAAEVRKHLRQEEDLQPDAVFAEVVHSPTDRLSNVLLRPVLREFEIPYLGSSGASHERQISISDLMLSIAGDRLVLRSRSLDREVIPRLTTAHNFVHPGCLPVYRFLCSLQLQHDQLVTSWSWGALESLDFLPRVRVGRIVLSRATWRLAPAEIQELSKSRADQDMFRAVGDWRKSRGIPRRIVLTDGDNQIPFDLTNILSVETFVSLIRSRDKCTVHEFFPPPEAAALSGPEGGYAHEVVVPFVKKAPTSAEVIAPVQTRPVRREVTADASVARVFTPGSEWLYAKLYTGAAQADRVLRSAIQPLIRDVTGSGAVNTWFFVRYGDPQPHIRLRMHGSPNQLLNEVLPMIHHVVEPLIRTGVIWSLQFDTYRREVERYGGIRLMPLMEEVFCADSDAVLTCLGTAGIEISSEIRLQLGLAGVNLLLRDFGLDTSSRLSLLRNRVGAGEVESVRQLASSRYRLERAEIQRTIEMENLDPRWRSALEKRAMALRQIARAIAEAGSLSDLGRPNPHLLLSLAHMSLNRILRWGEPSEELLIYEFLTRYYQQCISRELRADAGSNELGAR